VPRRAPGVTRARAIIVSGQGRAFCTGIDLSSLSGDRLRADWFRRWDVVLAKIDEAPHAALTTCLSAAS
jgi:enoyl-CoA hydratase/carnithine racemase